MRALTAYLVGGGTIVAAILIGLGGGIVAGNVMNPIAPKQAPDSSKLERRAEPAAMTNAPSGHVQYLAGSQVFGAVIAPPAQAEAPADTDTAKIEPATAKAEPPQIAKAEPQTTSTITANETKPADTPAAQPAKPAEQQASTEPSSSPENANAKAKDADVKRAAFERRRAERRQRWAERRRYEARERREMRDRPDWDDVARNVREDADVRAFASTPRRGFPQSNGFPQMRLFGSDDDD